MLQSLGHLNEKFETLPTAIKAMKCFAISIKFQGSIFPDENLIGSCLNNQQLNRIPSDCVSGLRRLDDHRSHSYNFLSSPTSIVLFRTVEKGGVEGVKGPGPGPRGGP